MRLVDGTMIVGSSPRQTTCCVAGCSGTDLYVQAHKATDGGAEIWWRCARHLVHPTFIPLVVAAGLPQTCEAEVGNVPCGVRSSGDVAAVVAHDPACDLHASAFKVW